VRLEEWRYDARNPEARRQKLKNLKGEKPK
jgi:hypothetical protein